MKGIVQLRKRDDTARVADLRQRVRTAMERPGVAWDCPECIDARFMDEPLPVRKGRAIALKLERTAVRRIEDRTLSGESVGSSRRGHHRSAGSCGKSGLFRSCLIRPSPVCQPLARFRY